MLEKEPFESYIKQAIDANFDNYSKYLNYSHKALFDLNTSFFEATKCSMLGLHKATITLTNFNLERLLKLALIYNEVGIGEIPLENLNSVFQVANKKYGSIDMFKSIVLCYENNLITEQDVEVLTKYIKNFIRNGFSHADSNKILKNVPNEMVGYHGSFSDPSNFEPMVFDQKAIPTFQTVLMDSFATQNSFPYFKYVFSLMVSIEDRLIQKKQ